MIRSFPIHSQAYKLEDVILDNGISNDLKLFFVQQDAKFKAAEHAQLISATDAKLKAAEQELQIWKVTAELDSLMRSMNAMTPRAFLEYIENWRMPKNLSTMSREEKWSKYLNDTEEGGLIMTCVKRNNKLWKGPTEVAHRIAGLYQFNSDYHHVTAHAIAANEPVELDRLAMSLQAFQLIVCLCDTLNIPYTTSNNQN